MRKLTCAFGAAIYGIPDHIFSSGGWPAIQARQSSDQEYPGKKINQFLSAFVYCRDKISSSLSLRLVIFRVGRNLSKACPDDGLETFELLDLILTGGSDMQSSAARG
jgi:hypothetical protein